MDLQPAVKPALPPRLPWYLWWRLADPQTKSGRAGLAVLLLIAVPCFVTLNWSGQYYDAQNLDHKYEAPATGQWFGTDQLGQSVLWRCLLGGAISLTVGISAAVISVIIGVTWGATSGYLGGRADAAMMRIVDVLYGLPYILLVVLLGVAVYGVVDAYKASHYTQREQAAAKYVEQAKQLRTQAAAAPDAATRDSLIKQADAADAKGKAAGNALAKPWLLGQLETYPQRINVITLIVAIGGVSWLTMARVIRGQVLSLREQPFVEAARACGVGHWRILWTHLLPNLIGPIVVYTTLTVPSAILQESFLSFLGIGVQAPLPSWGNLASDGLVELRTILGKSGQNRWWLLFWPCLLLGLTLMALNFLGDALRNRFDPKSRTK